MKQHLGWLACTFVLSITARANAHYIDASVYAGQTYQASSWHNAQTLLAEAFDDVCMDTFCEGDYSNLTSLRWRCSVEQETGRLASCVWIFAGSAEFIDSATGAIEVASTVVPCQIPVNGTVEAFLEGLFVPRGEQAPGSLLHRPLAGLDGTLYGSLSRCL